MECNIESYLNTIYNLQVGYNFFSSTNHKWPHYIIIPPASDGWSLWPFGYNYIEIGAWKFLSDVMGKQNLGGMSSFFNIYRQILKNSLLLCSFITD